ncbi:MAG: replication initiation factor domain-containing protein [Geobacteraceae bacterium]
MKEQKTFSVATISNLDKLSQNQSLSLSNAIRVAGTAGSPDSNPVQLPIMESSVTRHAPNTSTGISQKPPITNRGAQITIPPDNRSLLDWVSFTIKSNDPFEAVALIGLDAALFTEFQYGFSGYKKSLQYGNISVFYNGRDDMGCHVEMSGQGCRHYEAHFTGNPWQELFTNALLANANFKRLDLAIDNVDGALSLEQIHHACLDHTKQVRTLFSEWRRLQKGSFHESETLTGETIYLGSTKSHVMFRLYNKAQESGIDGLWLRFEVQLRDKRAHETAKLFITKITVGSLATGIINNYFVIINDDDSNKSRCTLQPWWSDWLMSTEKIRLTTEKEIKCVDETMEFIKRQYAPSLAMINKHLGGTPYKQFMQEMLDDGRERMGAKHAKILAASAGGNK